MQGAHARKRRVDQPAPEPPRPKLRVVDPAPVSTEAIAAPATERRTVQVRGRPEPHRRPSITSERVSGRPDRLALWAVLLGLFMVFMAAATAKADASAAHASPAQAPPLVAQHLR